MSGAEQEGATGSRRAALRSRVRASLGPTGAPPAWALVRYLVGGLVVGGALGSALPEIRGALLAALTGAVVAASGSGGPSAVSRRVALVSAVLGLVLTVIAFATGNNPVWAAIAMAAVALLTSLAAAAGPLGALLGFLGSLAYFLVATMARTANLFELVSFRWAAAHIAAGCVGGLIVVLVGTSVRRRHEPDEVRPSPPRRSRFGRCGSRCEASTSTRATGSGAPSRSRSSCTSSSARAAGTRSGSSSPRTWSS